MSYTECPHRLVDRTKRDLDGGEGLFVMHDRNKGVCTGCAHTVLWCEGAQSGGGDSVV